jgi:inner membrane transporter RhtA
VDLLWAALAGVGIALLLPIFHTGQRLDPLGIFYVLIAAFFWALYIIFGQKVGSTALHSGKVTAIGMVIASLVGIPSGVLHRGTLLLKPEVILLGFLMAILSSAIPYSLEMVALKKLPAKTFGILMSLEPVVGALIGFLYLKEQLSWTQWAAIILVISASMGSSLAVAKS